MHLFCISQVRRSTHPPYDFWLQPFHYSALRFLTGYNCGNSIAGEKQEWTRLETATEHTDDASALGFSDPATSRRTVSEKSLAERMSALSIFILSSKVSECRGMIGSTFHLVPSREYDWQGTYFIICFQIVVIAHFIFIWAFRISALIKDQAFFLLASEVCKENACVVPGSRWFPWHPTRARLSHEYLLLINTGAIQLLGKLRYQQTGYSGAFKTREQIYVSLGPSAELPAKTIRWDNESSRWHQLVVCTVLHFIREDLPFPHLGATSPALCGFRHQRCSLVFGYKNLPLNSAHI